MTDLLQSNGDQTEALDPNKNYLEQLVGDNKKFKDAEALAKGKFHSDETIKLLERRLDDLTADYQRVATETKDKATLKELIDQLSTKPSSELPPANGNNQPPIDLKDIEKLVSTKMQETETARVEQRNLDTVKNKLTERFGPNYQSAVKQQIDSLGLSSEDFHSLAKRSPAALFRTLGVDQQTEGFQAPPRSSQRSDNFAPTGAKKRTWSYYQELKKKNPELRTDRNIAIQMQKDAIELGEEFRDGDYYVPGLHDR